MRTSVVSLIAAAAVVGIVAIGIRPVLTAPNPNPDVRAADAEPQPFNPQMGALMNMIVQPRHAKLGLAGQAENWALATYYFKELKTGFGVVSRAIPRWKWLPVPDLIEASVESTFAVLDFAIKAGEPYVIDALRCTECVGAEDEPQCRLVCPVDGCIEDDPDFRETRDDLLAKYK